MTEVRAFQDADLPALLSIFNDIVQRGDAFVYDAPFTTQQMRQYVASYVAAYVAVRDGRVVGGYLLRPNQPGRGAHVANAAYLVAVDCRGRGVGRLLGEHSLREAKRVGFTAMQFNAVVSTNDGAVTLWRHLGFSV